MRITGPPKPRVLVTHAEKLWFHGRVKQRVTRAFCWVVGHDFNNWRDLDEGEEGWRPELDVTVRWFRACKRGCGTIQSGWASQLQLEDGALGAGNNLRHRFGRHSDGDGVAA